MRKFGIVFLTIFCLAVLVGCAGLDPNRGQQAIHGGSSIYKGQSTDSVEKVLGAPDVVSSGRYFCKNASSLPFGVMPGDNTVEWVYIGVGQSTVVYFDNGRVVYVHQIPSSQVRR
jgi:hypothetical protein